MKAQRHLISRLNPPADTQVAFVDGDFDDAVFGTAEIQAVHMNNLLCRPGPPSLLSQQHTLTFNDNGIK
jgi:hypothetical protein